MAYDRYAVDKITIVANVVIGGRKVEMTIQESIFVTEASDTKTLHNNTVAGIMERLNEYEKGELKVEKKEQGKKYKPPVPRAKDGNGLTDEDLDSFDLW